MKRTKDPAIKKLYNSKAWKEMRQHRLDASPLCVMCSGRGRYVPAEVVDHIKPHKGDADLFYDYSNLQSLCKTCHDGAKAKAEIRGIEHIGCDEYGIPIDPGHHWN